MRLIQRCEFKTKTMADVTGVDALFRYEYMGAAEYEFGTLPKSLRRIVANLSAYKSSRTKYTAKDGRALMLFAASDDALASLDEIATGRARVKMGSYLPEVLRGEDPKFYRTEVWWDVDNDWIAFLDEESGALIQKALHAVADRWATASAAGQASRP
jgi:hypothetical protein